MSKEIRNCRNKNKKKQQQRTATFQQQPSNNQQQPFNSSFLTMNNHQYMPKKKDQSSFLNHPNLNPIFLSPVTPEEVSKLISSMSPSKSSEPNSIPIKILKLVCVEISNPKS